MSSDLTLLMLYKEERTSLVSLNCTVLQITDTSPDQSFKHCNFARPFISSLTFNNPNFPVRRIQSIDHQVRLTSVGSFCIKIASHPGLACEQLSCLGEQSEPREHARASGRRVSSRTSTFHDIPQMESLLAG